MAVLLIALSVMGIILSVAMPAWKQMAQREKEAELVFRGQQYARAIGLFQKRAGPGVLPPNVDVLVQQRFLRKKYKDPITGDDFQLLLAGQQLPGQAGGQPTGPQGRGAQPGRGTPGQAPTTGIGAPTGAVGGIQGVVSKSKAKSLRVFNGRTVYNEWAFVFVPQVQAGGAGGAGGAGVPGGPGGGGSPGPGRGRFGQPGPGPGPGRLGGPGGGGGFGGPGGGGFPGPSQGSSGPPRTPAIPAGPPPR